MKVQKILKSKKNKWRLGFILFGIIAIILIPIAVMNLSAEPIIDIPQDEEEPPLEDPPVEDPPPETPPASNEIHFLRYELFGIDPSRCSRRYC